MYHDFEVGLPKVKGKIITRKKGAATYILYQYGSKYNPEKKYAVPQRTIIGKVNPEHPDHSELCMKVTLNLFLAPSAARAA